MFSLTPFNKYAHIIMLCIGCFIGFYICSLFNGCGPSKTVSVSGDSKMVQKLQQQVTNEQAVYHERIDSLEVVEKHLQGDLQMTQAALSKAKQKSAKLQAQVYALLDRPTGVTTADTVTQLADCDSLRTKVLDLMAGDSTKDSLYEGVTADLQEEVFIKDSVIHVQQEAYQSLKMDFDQSLSDRQALHDETKTLQKNLQRQKIKGTVRTIGLVIATALLAHFFTH